jgi:hypothetical protein
LYENASTSIWKIVPSYFLDIQMPNNKQFSQ